MAASKADSIGVPAMNEPLEAIKLCTRCPFDECVSPTRGCDEMKALKASLKAGKPYDGPPADWGMQKPKPEKKPVKESRARHYACNHDPAPECTPSIMLAEKVPASTPESEPCPPMYGERSLLMLCNLAIDALERLKDSIPELEWPPHLHAGSISLKQYRMQRFADLIDWAAIARGGSK